MLTVNVYIIVIYDVITVDYCKCILLYSPLNSYLYVHWILDFKSILLLLLTMLHNQISLQIKICSLNKQQNYNQSIVKETGKLSNLILLTIIKNNVAY